MRDDAELRRAVDGWLAATAERPEHVPAPDWLRWEQEKHSKLLAAAAAHRPTTLMETR
jgi:MerR family copper efflux transcriptional regulator